MTTAIIMAYVGVALMVGLSGMASCIGTSIAGMASVGAMKKNAGAFGSYMILAAIPGSQGLYGFVNYFIIKDFRTAAAPDKAKETTLFEGRLFRCGSRTDQIAPPIRKTAATVRMAYSSGNAARISVLPITSWPLPIAVIPLAQTFDWK